MEKNKSNEDIIKSNTDNKIEQYKIGFELITTVIESNGKNRIKNLKEALIKLREYTGSSDIAIYKRDDTFDVYDRFINIEKDYAEITDKILKEYTNICNNKFENVDLNVNSENIKRINIVPITTVEDKNYLLVITNNKIMEFQNQCEIIKKTMASVLTHTEHIIELDNIGKVDPLTGIGNRLAYNEKMRELEESEDIKNVTYTIADLFKLKAVNDEISHKAGDDYIVACDKALRGAFLPDEEENFVYRIGGDEFVVIAMNANEEFVDMRMKHANTYIKGLLDKYKDSGHHFEINYGSYEIIDGPVIGKVMYREADKKLSNSKRGIYRRLNEDRRR